MAKARKGRTASGRVKKGYCLTRSGVKRAKKVRSCRRKRRR